MQASFVLVYLIAVHIIVCFTAHMTRQGMFNGRVCFYIYVFLTCRFVSHYLLCNQARVCYALLSLPKLVKGSLVKGSPMCAYMPGGLLKV